METDKKKVQPVLSNRQVKKKNVEKAKKLKKKKLGRLRFDYYCNYSILIIFLINFSSFRFGIAM